MLYMVQFCDSGYISEQTKAQVVQMTAPLVALFAQAQEQMVLLDMPIPALFTYINGGIHALVKYHIEANVALTPALLDTYFAMAWNSVRR
jgi:hypothetical protein